MDDVLSWAKSFSAEKPKTPRSNIDAILDRMRDSVKTQESGGRQKVRNERTDATGYYQVMPANIPRWTKTHYGKSLTQEQFANDANAQEAVFRGEMGRYLDKALTDSPDEETAIRKAAAAWYGGEGAMHRYDDPKRFRPNEPSFREYTSAIVKRLKKPAADDPGVWDDVSAVLGEKPAAGGGEDIWAEVDKVIGKTPTPTRPVQTAPINKADLVVPEPSATIQAQAGSVLNGSSPKAAILINPDQESELSPMVTEALKRVVLPDGRILFVNAYKASNLGVTDYARDFAKLLGKVEDVGDNTGQGQAVVTLGGDGTELNSSIVTNPQAAAKQASLDRAMFPDAAKQEILPAQEAALRRYQQWLVERQMKDERASVDAFNVETQAENARLAEEAARSQPQETVRQTRTVQRPGKQPVPAQAPAAQPERPSARVNWASGTGKSAKTFALDEAASQISAQLGADYDTVRTYLDEKGVPGLTDEVAEQRQKDRQETIIDLDENAVRQIRAMQAQADKQKRRKETQTATAENQIKQYVDAGEVESVAQLLAAKDVGVKDIGGKPIAALIQEERDAIKRFDDDWLAQSEERQKQSEAYSQLTPTAPQFTDTERQRYLEGRASARKDEIAAAMKQYGSFGKRESEKQRIAEEYKYRPLAAPLEVTKGIISVVPKAASAILKTSDILAEINPASTQNVMSYFSGKEFKADEGEVYKLGKQIDEKTLQLLPPNADLKDYYQAGDSIGQMGLQIGLGALTGGVAAPLLYGSSLGASSQYEEAAKAGKYTRQGAAILGGLTAISDALPVAWALKPLRKGGAGKILDGFLNKAYKEAVGVVGEKEAQSFVRELFKRTVDRAKTVATGAALETGQEVFADKKINDLYASLTYDPQRKVFEINNDDLETAFFAAIGGAGAGVGRVAIEERLAPATTDIGKIIATDKQGNEYDVVEDRGKQVLVKDAKGKISVRNKDRLTIINEEQKVSKPAAPVVEEAILPDADVAPVQEESIESDGERAKRYVEVYVSGSALNQETLREALADTGLPKDEIESIVSDAKEQKRQRKLTEQTAAPVSGEQKKPAAPVTAAEPDIPARPPVEKVHTARPKGNRREAPLRPETLTGAKERLKEVEEQRDVARREAETDPLTGVPNRRALDRALPTAEADENTSVIAFDANNFGQINKKLGEKEGDKVLKEMADALDTAAKENGGRVFRKGGDEFTILAPKAKAEAIRDRAEEIFGTKNYDGFDVSVSGVVGNTFDEADAQLQDAKAAKKAKGVAKEPWRMRAKDFDDAVKASPKDQFLTKETVDWGPRQRGQGKRSGGMVRGAMSDAPQGKKTYMHILGGLSEDERRDLAAFDNYEAMRYAQARSLGLSPDDAFLVAANTRDKSFNAHEVFVKNAIERGDPVPAEVLADYPDLAPKKSAKQRMAEKVAGSPKVQVEVPWRPIDTISKRMDSSVFQDRVPQPIQREGQRVIDAFQKSDTATLKKLRDKHFRHGWGGPHAGGGAGPGKMFRPDVARGAIAEMADFALRTLTEKAAKPASPARERFEEKKSAKQRLAEKAEPKKVTAHRMGDFIEFFGEDAEAVGKELEVTITTNTKTGKRMAGIPYHAQADSVAKLVKKGYQVVFAGDAKERKTFDEEYGVPAEKVGAELDRLKGAAKPNRGNGILGMAYRLSGGEVDITADNLPDLAKSFVESYVGKRVASLDVSGEIVPVLQDKDAPKAKPGRRSVEVATTQESTRFSLNAYIGEKGYVVATDGHRLLLLKDPSQKERQWYDARTGEPLESFPGNFPNYEMVIPKEKDLKRSGQIDAQPIINYAKRVADISKNIDRAPNRPLPFVLTIGGKGYHFNPAYIYDGLRVLQANGGNQITVAVNPKATSPAVVFENEAGKYIVMPIKAGSDTLVRFPQEINLKGVKTESVTPAIATEATKADESLQMAAGEQTEKNLVAVHNLSESALRFADRMGGLALPSIAITSKDLPFTGYGDITLIADTAMVDPKAKVPVTDADMYSPRYPSATYKIDPHKFEKYWKEATQPYIEKYGEPEPGSMENYYRQHYNVHSESQDNGVREFERNPYFEAYYLSQNGRDLPDSTKQLREVFYDPTESRKLSEFAEKEFDGLVDKMRFYTGTDYNGNRRYREYTLDTVVKRMKSQMKDGENFSYGAGTLRSKAAKRFRNLDQIKKDRGRLTTAKDLELKKEEMNSRLLELAEEYAPFYKYDSARLGYTDTFVNAVGDGLQRKNLAREMREYGFENIDDYGPIHSYLDELTSLPTEYFEAKPQRAVGLREFKAAVIPSNASQQTRDILTRNQIPFTEYEKGNDESRRLAVESAVSEDQGTLFMQASDESLGRFKDVQFAHTQHLLENSDTKIIDVDGEKRIEFNEEASELARRVWADAVGKDVSPFYGATHSSAQLRRFAREARKWASEYQKLGYTPAQVKSLRQMSEAFTELANQAHGITYVFDLSLPEETHHKGVLDLLNGKKPNFKSLKEFDVWNNPKIKREYPGASDFVKALEIAAKLETDQITSPDKDAFLRAFADAIIDKVGPATDTSGRILKYATPTSDTGREEGLGTKGEGSRSGDERDRASSEGARDRTAEAPERDGSGTADDFRPDGREKLSQTPKSLRGKADIPVADRTYTGVTNAGQQTFADEKMDAGVDDAARWFSENAADNNLNGGATAVVGLNLLNHYAKTRQFDKMNSVADELVPMVTQAAQTVQAMATVSAFNPQMAAAYAAKVKKQKQGTDLTPEEAVKAERIAKNLSETAQVEALAEAALKEAQAFIKDLEKDIEQANESIQTLSDENKTVKVSLEEARKIVRQQKAQITRLTNDKPRTPNAKKIKELRKRKDDILTALAEKYGTPSLQMVAPSKDTPTMDEFEEAVESLNTLDLEDDQVRYPDMDGKESEHIGGGEYYDLYIHNREAIPEAGPFEIFITDDKANQIGFIRATTSNKTISINLIHLQEDSRGYGIGTDIYKQFLNDGYTIKSDTEITDATQSLYLNLAAEGYEPIIFDDGRVGLKAPANSFQMAASDDSNLHDWAVLTLGENWGTISVGDFYNLANRVTNGALSDTEIKELHASAVEALRSDRSQTDSQKAAFKTRSEHLRAARKFRKEQGPNIDKTAAAIMRMGVEGNYSDDAIIFALARKKHVNPKDAIEEYEQRTGEKPSKETMVEANQLINDTKRTIVRDRLQAREESELTDDDIQSIKEEQSFNRSQAAKARKDANQFYEGLARTPYEVGLETVVNLRRSNLLTGVKTHLRNITSNAMFAASEETSRPLAWMVDAAASGLTGERTVQGASPKAIWNSFNSLIREDETFKNLDRESGLKLAKQIIMHGATFEELAKQQHSRSVLGEKAGKPGKVFDAYINKVFDTLGAEDAVFKTYAFRRSLEEQAKTMAKDKDERMALILKPTNTMVQIASDYADFATFTNDNWLSNAIRSAKVNVASKGKTGQAVKALFETVVPYDRTPTNIFLRVMEHSPIGFVSAGAKLKNLKQAPTKEFRNKYRGAITLDLQSTDDFLALPAVQQRRLIDEGLQKVFTRQQQQEFARTFGRASLGTGVFGLGFFLAAAGLLTGSMSPEDDDREETNEFFKRREMGVENRSLLIPGVGRFVLPDDPLSKVLTAGATAYEQTVADRGAPVASAWNGAKEVAEDAFFEQPLAGGVHNFYKQIKGAKLGEFAGGLIGTTLIPTFVSDIGEIADPKARTGSGYRPGEKRTILNPYYQWRGFKNTLLKRVPGVRNVAVDESTSTVPQEVRGGVLRRAVRAVDIFNTRPPVEYKPLTAPDGTTDMINSPEFKKMTTDDVVTIIKYDRADGIDTKQVEAALIKKVKNAQKAGTFTADEAKRVNEILGTNYRPDESRSKKRQQKQPSGR